MNMSAIKGSCLWAGIFVLLFLFSQLHWFLADDPIRLGPWNFPLRIYYFLLLQFLLAVALGLFLARRSGRKPNNTDPGD